MLLLWDFVTRIWREARQTLEVVAASRSERWQGMSMSEPSSRERPEGRRVRPETWMALIVRLVDQLLRSRPSSMVVVTDRGGRFPFSSGVLCGALGRKHARASLESGNVGCVRKELWRIARSEQDLWLAPHWTGRHIRS